MTCHYRIPMEQLEARSRVAEVELVVLVGDGAVPPVVSPVEPAVGDDAGDGD
jgi:hypothetical protein